MSKKVKLPSCTNCQTDKYMAWSRVAEKVGTVAGGAIGAGAAYASMSGGATAGAAIGSIVPGAGTIVGATLGGIAGVLLAAITGVATGNAIGEQMDQNIRMRCYCTNCGYETVVG